MQSRPYFLEDFNTQGYGVKGDLLQLNLSYARFWNGNRSLVVRVGQLSSAFGAFLHQRYDPMDNTVIGVPSAYGYYYKPVTFEGLARRTGGWHHIGKLDARAQFVNSSPANRRSVFDSDQYGNWAGGLGYTIRQGLRIGGSAYYGPYLDRQSPVLLSRRRVEPRELPARAVGVDVEWGAGHWECLGRMAAIRDGLPCHSHVYGTAGIRGSPAGSESAMSTPPATLDTCVPAPARAPRRTNSPRAFVPLASADQVWLHDSAGRGVPRHARKCSPDRVRDSVPRLSLTRN